jgi:hypothetical protein
LADLANHPVRVSAKLKVRAAGVLNAAEADELPVDYECLGRENPRDLALEIGPALGLQRARLRGWHKGRLRGGSRTDGRRRGGRRRGR